MRMRMSSQPHSDCRKYGSTLNYWRNMHQGQPTKESWHRDLRCQGKSTHTKQPICLSVHTWGHWRSLWLWPQPPQPPPQFSTTHIHNQSSRHCPPESSRSRKLSLSFVREVSTELSPLYTRLFQKSVDEDHVVRQWKAADVAPICKNGEMYDPANYQPVSFISVTYKCL